jgi:multidrug efflux pump subunit AcrB
MVSTSTKDDLLQVSEAIKNELISIQPTLPIGVKTDVMADMAPYIKNQLGMLSSNALLGLIIVIILLSLFLEIKLALWVAMGIPISLAGAIWMMGLPGLNYSINDITLFGMILVLGILVDDAIVVGESIHQARQKYSDPKEAALKGVNSVAVATVFGVLTTIAAFSPMLWIENELAKVLAGFSAVVIFALIFSLIESKFILPCHLSFPKKGNKGNVVLRALERLRKRLNDGLNHFNEYYYVPTLKTALNNKITTIFAFSLLVLSAYSAVIHGHIRSAFFPEIPSRYGTLIVKMDQIASPELSAQHLYKLESAAIAASNALNDTYDLGYSPFSKLLVSRETPQKLELTIELTEEALADIPSEDVLAHWKKYTGILEGSLSMDYSLSSEPAGGSSIVVSALNRDLAIYVAGQIKQDLMSIKGVTNVLDNSTSGRRQLQVTLNERGTQLGIDQRSIARIVGSTYGEIEIHRLLEKGEEISVVVKVPSEEKKTLEQLASTPIQLANDRYVSLGDVVNFTFSDQADLINRRNYDEVIRISWRQAQSVISAEEVFNLLSKETIPQLIKIYPEVKVTRAGALAEQEEVQAGFKKAMLLTLLLIYVLLAIPLKSYWQPLIIMSIIPFGFAGAIFGHGLMGLPVSLLSMFGMMAMTGVVINDSLVLLTRFNQLHESGLAVKDALIEAGKSRMRAIFLTTLTTVCGLLPLLFETSEQAQYLKPAAVSLVFGELFATPITLILIPVILGFGKYKSQKRNVHDKTIAVT